MESEFRFPIPPNIRQIRPYKPGKPSEELRREMNLARVIKLASNENSWGPSPRAVQAIIRAASETNRYPDGSGFYLRQALSRKLDVAFENIILGNGSTDLVEVVARTYLQPGDNTVTADVTFVMYRIATIAMNAECITVPTRDYTYDLSAIAQAINHNTRIVYIANPNNPTGTMVGKPEMEDFLRTAPSNVLIVLDEAYREFIDTEDFPDGISYLQRYPNLIVLRTFSKVYGLAGMRIGYGLACEEIITNLNRIRSPFNTSALAQHAGLAALDDDEYVRQTREVTAVQRSFLQDELKKLNIFSVPSVTNFVLVPIPNSVAVFEALLAEGIIVRPMQSFGLQDALRVTIGKREDNVAFLEAFSEVLQKI